MLALTILALGLLTVPRAAALAVERGLQNDGTYVRSQVLQPVPVLTPSFAGYHIASCE